MKCVERRSAEPISEGIALAEDHRERERGGNYQPLQLLTRAPADIHSVWARTCSHPPAVRRLSNPILKLH